MSSETTLTWLGVAGIQIQTPEKTILIDPYISRFSLKNLLFNRLVPDIEGIKKYIAYADWILVTHPHFDHFTDVPYIARIFGATIFGSSNTCRLSVKAQVPVSHIREVNPGDIVLDSSIKITVLKAKHLKTFLAEGDIPRFNLQYPFRLLDMRMEKNLAYRITVNGITILTDPGNCTECFMQTDILLLKPHYTKKTIKTIIDHTTPKLILPIHWDDFLHPIDCQRHYSFNTVPRSFLPFKKTTFEAFKYAIQESNSTIKIIAPTIMKPYILHELLL